MADKSVPPPAATAKGSTKTLSTSTINVGRKIWATAFVRGGLFLVIGLSIFFWPNIANGLIKWLLIILFVLQAALFAIEASRQPKDDRNAMVWRYALAGVALAVAIALLVWPESTIKVVLKLVAVWALISGVLGTLAALRRYRERKPAWDWELTTSLLWIVFGVMVVLKSLDNPAAVTAALSVYLTVTGVVLLVAAWSLRVYKGDLNAASASALTPAADAIGTPVVAAPAAGSTASASAPTAPIPAVKPTGEAQ